MARKKLLIANWKLNHTRSSALEFFNTVLPSFSVRKNLEVAIAPVTPMLDFVGQCLMGQPIFLAAQNVFYVDKGAYTGEWSVVHLQELGVKFCIVGHSERRTIFFETDEDVRKKAQACLKSGIMPVICVGESASERRDEKTCEVIKKQISAVLLDWQKGHEHELIFAYEPIWAIGTGNTATSRQAQEIHQFIRATVSEICGEVVANSVRILYGGSVNAQNIEEIVTMPDIDGALVGGASLQADSFLSMVEKLKVF